MFGIGEGKLEVLLPKENYRLGEKIEGQVRLTVNSEKQAKGLKVRFKVVRMEWTPRQFKKGSKEQMVTVFEKELSLAPEGTFSGVATYDFELETNELASVVAPSAVLRLNAFLDAGFSLGFSKSKALVISR